MAECHLPRPRPLGALAGCSACPAGTASSRSQLHPAAPHPRAASTPTQAGARVVLASHLGRPKGPDPKSSLKPVAARLGELLGQVHRVQHAGGSQLARRWRLLHATAPSVPRGRGAGARRSPPATAAMPRSGV